MAWADFGTLVSRLRMKWARHRCQLEPRVERWSSRVGDLVNDLVASGPLYPGLAVQRLSRTLSGSNPYTTTGDVNVVRSTGMNLNKRSREKPLLGIFQERFSPMLRLVLTFTTDEKNQLLLAHL